MKVFVFLWRVWFVILNLTLLAVLLPALYISTVTGDSLHWFMKLARVWSWGNVYGMGFTLEVEKEYEIDKSKSYMIISNHTSMMDIMLTFIIVPIEFVFVGKSSLAKLPIFGTIYKRTSILVDRSSTKSRQKVFSQAFKVIDKGQGICMFPEGGVPDDLNIRLDKFQRGAFALAIKCNIPILPITYGDTKERFPFSWTEGNPGKMRCYIHKPIETTNMTNDDLSTLKDKCYEVIDSQLKVYGQ